MFQQYSTTLRPYSRIDSAELIVLPPTVGPVIVKAVLAFQVLAYHRCQFEQNSIIEIAQIEVGYLLDFVQAVNQGVTMHKQLPRRFGSIQIIFKKFIDGQQGLSCLLYTSPSPRD